MRTLELSLIADSVHHSQRRMDFALLFTITSALTFTLQFGVDDSLSQDYFIFQGGNQTAHLHRSNQSLYLHLVQGTGMETYKIEVTEAQFNFSWVGQIMNGKPMKIIKKVGNVTSMNFDQFTFLSPVHESFQDLDCHIDTHFNKKGSNYWYMVGVAIFVVIVCKSYPLVRKAIAAILKKEDRELFNQTADLVEDILATADGQLTLETAMYNEIREENYERMTNGEINFEKSCMQSP